MLGNNLPSGDWESGDWQHEIVDAGPRKKSWRDDWNIKNVETELKRRRQEKKPTLNLVKPAPARPGSTYEERVRAAKAQIAAINASHRERRREDNYDAPAPGFGTPKPISNVFVCAKCKCNVNTTDVYGLISQVTPETKHLAENDPFRKFALVPCPDCSPVVLKAQGRAMKKKLVQRLVTEGIFTNDCNYPEGWKNWTVDSYQRLDNANMEILRTARNMINGRFNDLFLNGPSGRGKTGVAVSIGRGLEEQGYSVLFLTIRQYINMLHEDHRLARSYDKEKQPVKPYEIKKLAQTVECLIIDDLGTEYVTDNNFVLGEIEELIDIRFNKGLKTLITSNMTKKGLKEYYFNVSATKTGFQPSDRLISRLSKYTDKNITGVDLRGGK